MSDENIAIVQFYEGWIQEGVGPDGLPLFKEQVMIRKSVPPLTEIARIAMPEEFEEFPLQYQYFRKQQKGRKPEVEGYPLALWPVISAADFQNCVTRDIVTVEQLAALAKKRGDKHIPPPMMELAKRAAQLVELQKEVGKFEALINQLTAEREALSEDLKEAHATISVQNSQITMLQSKAA